MATIKANFNLTPEEIARGQSLLGSVQLPSDQTSELEQKEKVGLSSLSGGTSAYTGLNTGIPPGLITPKEVKKPVPNFSSKDGEKVVTPLIDRTKQLTDLQSQLKVKQDELKLAQDLKAEEEKKKPALATTDLNRVSEETARALLKTDFTGATRNDDGTYTLDETALARISQTATPEQTATEKTIADNQALYDKQIEELENFKFRTPEEIQQEVSDIQAKYQARSKQMEDINRRRLGLMTKMGFQGGGAQYTSKVNQGILAAEEIQGTARLAEIDADMRIALRAANDAVKKEEWDVLKQKLAIYDKKDAELKKQIEELNKTNIQQAKDAADTQKTLAEFEKITDENIAKKTELFAQTLAYDLTDDPEQNAIALDNIMQSHKEFASDPEKYAGALLNKAIDYRKKMLTPDEVKGTSDRFNEWKALKAEGETDLNWFEYNSQMEQSEQKPSDDMAGMSSQQRSYLNQLRTQARLDENVKVFPQIRGAYEQGRSAAQKKNGMGDVILMRTIAKITDPTTGVREEEFNTFDSAQGTMQKFGVTMTKKWWSGDRLSEVGRTSMLQTLEEIYRQREAAYLNSKDFWDKEAIDAGINASVIPSYIAPQQVEDLSMFDE